jgi:hypothetical protein
MENTDLNNRELITLLCQIDPIFKQKKINISRI